MIATRLGNLKGNPTFGVAARAAQRRAEGHDVISLSLGEPDFETPEHVKRAAITALSNGATKYTAVAGTNSLRKAIVDKLRSQNGLEYGADEILVSCGAKHSVFNLLHAVIEEGDEVIIPAPYWPSYLDITVLAGGRPVVVPSSKASGFKLSPQKLQCALSAQTKILVLNSPSNPTGSMYSMEELRALGEILRSHPRLMILSDDIYEHIVLTEKRFCSLLNACPELRDRVVLVNGVSKCYAMTGWRIGYAAGPASLVSAMEIVQSHTTSNASSVSQAAAEAALRGDQTFVREMAKEFSLRGEFVWKALSRLPGIECVRSEGAFYAFPDCGAAIRRLHAQGVIGEASDTEFVAYLLDEAGIAVVPGSAFGMPGHVRISFASSMEMLEIAMQRFEAALK